jgi:RNA-directed DNA polymerase
MFDVRHLLSHGASWRRFQFLGFTHMCAKTRNGRFKLKRVTSKKKMRAKLASVKTEIRRRWHHSIPEQGHWLASVLAGHCRYYAVPDNIRALQAFRERSSDSGSGRYGDAASGPG